jgi:ketopantoate reductase
MVLKSHTKGNKPKFITINVVPFTDTIQKGNKVLVINNDITELQNKQNLVQTQMNQITALFKLSSLYIIDDHHLSFFNQIMAKTSEMLESETVRMYLFDPRHEDISNRTNKKLIDHIVSRRDFVGGLISNNAKKEFGISLSRDNIERIIMALYML